MAEFYTTRDLDLVAIFSMNDIRPTEVKQDGKLMQFLFEDSVKIQDLANRYFNEELMVKAKTFALARKFIKYQYKLKAEKRENING